ncbi:MULTISPECIES: efflux RND transporter permease subunit [Paracoccus]|jgi:multidrug efflux pump|uniref:Efflux pump membrane transporter n=1 Tax=Paracoccus denitrificans (strain Pd 1222) TaxID=318586 RepID=A1B5L2_PARDP|nr:MULTISPECIES: efflux RND transporter permease subunit [Paracoccus]ABL70806.1 transporter, hydrophobe/amphiphile efflux-1 (HAE1) family [Paracoccus denitrificans PD1222]MBB4627606.1 multidrug efflux pump [Paracoccus denitrificans]MCU7429042.1 efflux RND transporter permease subunit [Paracoccus denitrificans]QAR26129.1 multidrug efflux RND transporter permease subunit [Paracoccus denitrificans]UPV95043.1 efflux RND transporter permease subunit [Paracoccus denitrificans]
MAQFFIHRPVFAWVLAIVTMLIGTWSLIGLPVSQYPDIAPTTIRITANYSGATARAVQNSVTTPIEDALTGLDGLLYTVSSASTGRSVIELTFDDSVEPVDALNEVQSKVRSVESRLPTPVQNDGVSVTRSSSSILMVGSLVSTTGQHSTIELGNLLEQVVEGPVKRTEGVGGVNVFGSGYAMRIWMDPLRLAQFQLTPTDLTTAVAQQNSTVSVGALGEQPVVAGQQFTANITAQSQLTSVEDFRNILLKTGEDGATVRLGDVAEVEIGQTRYGRDSRFNGMNASGFAVNLATGANAVETASAVRATLEGLKNALPEGVEVHIAYDTAPFVELSIEKVYHTLIEAIGLVFLVILLFLQNWRATLIPIIAIPVVLLGTFGMLAALGYSVNTLTMFAMVLAIGLLVDDAIVVVENVERVMQEDGLGPVEATEKSMGQISGALIGIALVLSAVFLPMGFMPGSTGVIYRQFSVTIITAMVLSLLVALILTPAMCASLLRQSHGPARFAPARWFNAGFERVTRGYSATVRRSLRRPMLVMLLLAAISYGATDLFGRMHTTFIPGEDQGVLQSRITLTEGSTAQQTAAVVQEIENYMLTEEKAAVESVFVAMGFGFSGTSQSRAMVFVKLRDFDQRKDPALAASAVASRANARFEKHRAGRITFLQPPAIPRLGNAAGFSMFLLDQSGGGAEALTQAAKALELAAAEDPRLQSVESSGTETEAALKIDIDQQKAESLGVSLSGVNAMLSTIFAGTEVNDFALGAQLRPVVVQGAAANRMQPEDVDSWYARNADGEMVPFTAFMTTRWEPVEPSLSRMDSIDAIEITGQQSDSASSGVAMAAMEELVAQLPGGYGTAWTGLSYQERQSGNQAPWLFALSALVVFLSLAALYESWSIPFSVMLAVPVGVLGAVVAALTFGQANDVYFKVGILTTIGLAAKNAILIVEFARELEQSGRATVEAAVEAARLRLRPILMTSLAFILGVLPLAIATGAGAAAQNSIGIGVMGGMIAATFLGIFMVPAFYVTVRRLTDRRART